MIKLLLEDFGTMAVYLGIGSTLLELLWYLLKLISV